MVRLLLADLLPDVERAVLLPLPSVATADVAALAELDLEGRAARRPRPPRLGRERLRRDPPGGRAALVPRPRPPPSLRRTAHARHAFDFDAFTTDVLVLDLARMREQGFSREALPLVEEFGLGDVEALHYLVGPDRATRPARVGGRPDPQPAARPRPRPLGRPREALAARAHARARALAPPRGAVPHRRALIPDIRVSRGPDPIP